MNFRKWVLEEAAAEYSPYAFHAIILAGGPGSGKSRIGRTIAGGFGFQVADSDRILELTAQHKKQEYLLGLTSGQPGYDTKMSASSKAVELNVKRAKLWRTQGIPYIIDITGRNYGLVTKLKGELEDEGYDVFMVFVNTPLEIARARNQGRRRRVDDDFLVNAWQDSMKFLNDYHNLFGKKFLQINNDEQIEDKSRIGIAAGVPRMVGQLLTPNHIDNPIGKQKLEEMKGKFSTQPITVEPQPKVANVGSH
jgi:adenylate kinase family enzyme